MSFVLVLNLEYLSFLQVELSNLLDGARQTETKMVEMSALNHLMATHVLQQAQQIEVLYDQVGFLLTPLKPSCQRLSLLP